MRRSFILRGALDQRPPLETTFNRQGRHSIDDILRAFADAGMTARKTYAMQDLFEVAEHAIGSPHFREAYQACATQPLPVDVDTLWRQLGLESGRVTELVPNSLADIMTRRWP